MVHLPIIYFHLYRFRRGKGEEKKKGEGKRGERVLPGSSSFFYSSTHLVVTLEGKGKKGK